MTRLFLILATLFLPSLKAFSQSLVIEQYAAPLGGTLYDGEFGDDFFMSSDGSTIWALRNGTWISYDYVEEDGAPAWQQFGFQSFASYVLPSADGIRALAVREYSDQIFLMERDGSSWGEIDHVLEGTSIENFALAGDGNSYVYGSSNGGWDLLNFVHLPSSGVISTSTTAEMANALSHYGYVYVQVVDERVDVFEPEGDHWVRSAIISLRASDAEDPSIAISMDGRTIAVGYIEDSSKSEHTESGFGYVEIFDFVAGQWQRQAFIEGEDEADEFGASVAISPDGRFVLSGAQEGGYVKLFDRESDWASVESEHFAGVPESGWFGSRVAIGQSGNTLILAVGDGGEDFNSVHDAGAIRTYKIDVTPPNTAPTAVDDAFDVLEDNGVNGNLLDNDSDEDGDPLTASTTLVSEPELGTVELAEDGTFSYVPFDNETGEDSFVYQISDGTETATATVTLTIIAVNDAPDMVTGMDVSVAEDAGAQSFEDWASVSPGPYNETEDQTVTVTVTTDNDDLFSVAPAISASGTLTFTPAKDAHGVAQVSAVPTDDGGTEDGGSDTGVERTFTITITAVNDPPSVTAGPDQSVLEDAGPQSVAGWATNISAGPENESAQLVSFEITTTNDALFAESPTVSPEGTLTYTPAVDANGSADVTVTPRDDGGTENEGADSGEAVTFSIEVTPVNDAPLVTLGTDVSILEDAGPQALDGWTSVFSPGPENEASQVMSFALTTDNDALFAELPALDLDGRLTFSAAADAFGSANVTVVLSDDGGTEDGGLDASEPQTFSIEVVPVNDAPSFTPGNNVEVDEDADPQSIAGWATALSPGPANEAVQGLSFTVTATNTQLFAIAPAVGVLGNLTFTLAPDANGVSEVTVQLVDTGETDNGGVDTSEPAVFLIRVAAVNDPPVLTLPPPQSVEEDGTLALAASVIDIDSSTLSVTLTATSRVDLGTVSGVTITGGASGSSSVSFSGPVSAVTTALSNLTYRPDPNYSGQGSLAVWVSDGEFEVSGEIVITVVSVNDAPVAVPDAAATFAGETVLIRPLTNDSDPEGDMLSVVSITQPSSGTATLHTDGTVTYTAAAEFDGQILIGYVLSDGTDTAPGTITVHVKGPGPDGDGIEDSVEAGAPNGGDGNGDGIPDAQQRNVASIPVATGARAGQFLTLATASNMSFEHVESDDIPDPENAPVGADFPVGLVSFKVRGLEVGQSTVVTVILPRGATVVTWYMYGPTADNPAAHWYEFQWDGTTGAVIHPETLEAPPMVDLHFTDGLRGDHDLVANGIIVDPGVPVFKQNALPQAVADAATLDEDTFVTVTPLSNDSDPDGDALVLRSITAAGHGAAVLNTDGSVTYTPAPDFFGADAVTYRVSDGLGTSVQATISFTVLPVEDAPVAVADSANTAEDTPVTIAVLANDYDADGDSFYLIALGAPSHGTAVYQSGLDLVYTPDEDFEGIDAFTYAISDRPGVVVHGTVTVTVTGTNDVPVPQADAAETPEDTPLNVDVLANDTDADGDALQVSSLTQPEHGTVTVEADGTVTYTPPKDFAGTDRFRYTVSDGQAESEEVEVALTVTPVNDAPVFEAQPLSDPGSPVVLAANTFEVTYGAAVDVDDTELVYTYELATTKAFTEVLLSREAAGGTISLDADTELLPVLEAAGLSVNQDLSVFQRLTATDAAGARAASEPIAVTFARGTATGTEDSEVPEAYYLEGNYPNPFNPSTTLVFGLPAAGDVTVDLYDLTGRRVRTLVAQTLAAGNHRVQVDLSGLSTGVYLYHFRAGGHAFSRTLHLVK